ncbi:glycosyltransferase family 2 protein [Bacillus mobilis]|uniref:Glycosyltransferase 2-like domain-containing protein n=2 Tax=Bacillus cereus group TaxID=86661 RepID=A0A1C4FHE3_BACCE|nr:MULTISPECIES: glycosyltransferase family 2 protein [Bacillus cereus group]OKA35312.1 hypothetical protein BJR06_20460 [Bacillus cereus]OKA39003.1 hypothetical protein BJR07_13990 [Bacillus cereus]SCC55262.1 Putative glycosyltransferase [Bacillus mobilis]
MNLQVLVSTMHQDNHNLIEKMNIQSDAIVVNQCERNEFEEFTYKGHNIKFLSLAERGVGLSRNTAFMRATADICIFADDDVVYCDNYKKEIIDAFKNNPDADVIVFNVPSTNPARPSYQVEKEKRVRFFNSLRYSTVRFAVRTKKVKEANIHFSLLFGGGAKYGSGEDSLFIFDCIKKGLKVYASPKVIAYVSHENSTWFTGYTDKYFIDKGALYASLSKRWARFLSFQFAFRHRGMYKKDKSWNVALKLMFKGIRELKG